MTQCEKILDRGERCANQAVPGSHFCQTHGRIVYKPVKKPIDTAPLSPLPALSRAQLTQAMSEPRSKSPAWKAAPSPAGQAPFFPGLHRDIRNILVAPQGIIWLQGDPSLLSSDLYSRLVHLLGFLSQSMELAGQVTLLSRDQYRDILLVLTPVEDHGDDLSLFYDAASAAAQLVDARLYIGQGNAFVQYRDDGASHGYDVPDFKATTGDKERLLVAHWGTCSLTLTDFTEVPLADFCLRIAPLLDVAGLLPRRIYALTPPPLFPILAKYFRAHRLHYGLTRLRTTTGELILFEIQPRPDAPAGKTLPSFIVDYLTRLPRVVVLTLAYQTNDQRILLQWRHHSLLSIPHVAGVFAPDDLVLLMADHYPNLRINPVPQFFDGDYLLEVHTPQLTSMGFGSHLTCDTAMVKLPILLRPDHGPVPHIAALILTNEEVGWLRQLLYRLPGEVFGAYSLCLGQDYAVLAGFTHPIEGIPFGLPLRRIGETELFIPLRSTFVPDLPWPILRQALQIQENVYTFFTPDYRLDLQAIDFAPLSRILIADPNWSQVKLNVRAETSLPELQWVPPPASSEENRPEWEQSLGEPVLSNILNPGNNGDLTAESAVPNVPETSFDSIAFWRQQARTYELVQDFLAAAFCYSFINDVGNSARCFRQATATILTLEQPRE